MIPAALTIAGSDSCGGAGIQADLRTFDRFGVHGATAITAITSQTPHRISRVDSVPPEAVLSQIRAVRRGLNPAAVKTGMIYSAEIAEAVHSGLKSIKAPLIVDPVMISTSGTLLMHKRAIKALSDLLFPLADWLTPNLHEAKALIQRPLSDDRSVCHAAADLAYRFQAGVIIKGGHREGEKASDIIFDGKNYYILSSPRLLIDSLATHGTGCTFSAAFAAGLALGQDWQSAVIGAKTFVYGSLLHAANISGIVTQMHPPPGDWIPEGVVTMEYFK